MIKLCYRCKKPCHCGCLSVAGSHYKEECGNKRDYPKQSFIADGISVYFCSLDCEEIYKFGYPILHEFDDLEV